MESVNDLLRMNGVAVGMRQLFAEELEVRSQLFG